MPDNNTAQIAIWKIPSASGAIPIPLPSTASSLDTASRQLPGGAYTTFRTFDRYRVLHLLDHFARLEETARLAGHPLQLDRTAIRAALRSAIAQYPNGEMRIRISIDLEQEAGTVYLMLEMLHIPSDQDYQQGVQVVTHHLQRQNPKAKLTGFIETASRVRQTLPAGTNEAVMVGEDGCLLEGLSSNFFAVLDGELWTAEQGVLSGITRSMVLACAAQIGIPVRLESLPLVRLQQVSEAFITSASRAVLPVTRIDDATVGGGLPGPITLSLLARYRLLVDENLESL